MRYAREGIPLLNPLGVARATLYLKVGGWTFPEKASGYQVQSKYRIPAVHRSAGIDHQADTPSTDRRPRAPLTDQQTPGPNERGTYYIELLAASTLPWQKSHRFHSAYFELKCP